MRKHHTRWVALCSAVAISTAGLACLAGPAAADAEDTRTFAWPMVSQGVSSYSLDGYEITYLPPGVERYGINATSTTDGQGNRRSQLSWVQGPGQLYGRVGVLRAERLQGIDDLRESRYSHLSESSLEQLPESETFEHGAYLAEESGDLFWIDEPGVALTTHLQPERWESAELMRLAESITEMTETEEVAATEAEKAPAENPEDETSVEEAPAENPEDEASVEEAPTEEGPAEEAPAAEAPTEEAPAEEAPAEETPTEEVPAEETPAEEAPATEEAPAAEAPEEEAPVETETTDKTPVTETPSQEETPEDTVPEDTVPDETDPIETGEETPQAPVDETPVEEVPAAEEGTGEAPSEEAAGEDGTGDETTVPDKVELPDGVSSHEVKACLTEHFVDFDSASSKLDHELMTHANEKFVAEALDKNDLSDDERDRLLATVWYYGHEDDKVAAVDDCAQRFGLERREVEDVISEVDDLIAGLVQEADGTQTDTTGQAEGAQSDTTDQAVEGETGEQVSEEEGSADARDPIGADEWEKLWNSLPWSVPTANP